MSDNLQERYFELLDLWNACKAEGDKLQAEVTKAFMRVASGTGSNPTDGVLTMLDSQRERQQRLWDEMQKILEAVARS
ncbi:hypothetical protein [Novosphingobium sp. AAP93]|uniref:hypothetical protein n=1 Tax=Novosphingobium sp. AAP93 TaxID=1523427 RepID=UPI0006B9084E|nr:hypothetical protein [Novosphingobium sp. AAP93]KPF77947.1 hypothetical protein IP83_19230 [Novosphingobium sp. AAP93]